MISHVSTLLVDLPPLLERAGAHLVQVDKSSAACSEARSLLFTTFSPRDLSPDVAASSPLVAERSYCRASLLLVCTPLRGAKTLFHSTWSSRLRRIRHSILPDTAWLAQALSRGQLDSCYPYIGIDKICLRASRLRHVTQL